MGHKSQGKWYVQSDKLCLDRGKKDSGCYEAWISGSKVELRLPGSDLPLLQKPAGH